MDHAELNGRFTSRVEFRLEPVPPASQGVLADPGQVDHIVRTPAGVSTTYRYGVAPEVVKDQAGRYHQDVAADQAGLWALRWEGSGGGPNAAVDWEVWVSGPLDGAPLFGATRAGVLDYVPHRQLSDTTKPSLGQVDRYLGDVANRVQVRLGGRLRALRGVAGTSSDLAADLATYEAQAANLVELGAASFVEGAGYPERNAGVDQEETTLGATYWARFQTGLKELEGAIRETLGRQPDQLDTAQSPAYAFPDTITTRRATTWSEGW